MAYDIPKLSMGNASTGEEQGLPATLDPVADYRFDNTTLSPKIHATANTIIPKVRWSITIGSKRSIMECKEES